MSSGPPQKKMRQMLLSLIIWSQILPSVCHKNAPNRTKLRVELKKKIPGGNTPDRQPGEGDTPSPDSSPGSALRASIRGLRTIDVSTDTSLW